MKLIIQIPCYNEAGNICETIARLPRHIEGIEAIELLIVDDGCTDGTGAIAMKAGADHIVTHKHNLGLARSFSTGLQRSIELGADIIINTDADNQYNADDIPALLLPILNQKADIVIGARPISTIEHFSPLKKILQRIGSWVVRCVSNTDIPDAPSGYRAISRDAAMQLNIFSGYTYTIEMVIQAGLKGMAIESVPIRVNPDLRPSRLVKSIPSYIGRAVITIIRIFIVYQPFRFFMTFAVILAGSGGLFGVRFLYLLAMGEGKGHVQSVVLAGVLLVMGLQTFVVAFLADIIAVNRKILEKIDYKINKQTEK